MNYYLSRNYKNISGAGNKAKTDIEHIMQLEGYKNAGLTQTHYTNPLLGFLSTLAGVIKVPFILRKNDTIVLQYPFKKHFTISCFFAHLKGAKVIVIIHDLGSFRRKKLTLEKEIKRLNHADYIIAHNQSMKTYLIQNGCTAQVGELGIFDYLSPSHTQKDQDSEPSTYSISYAGALAMRKNKFLYDLGTYIHSYKFLLFGNGFEASKVTNGKHIHYQGFVHSDQFIANPKGDFGLVWDGDSINSCTGNFGEYLRYNNPHKTSFYLRCGMPVIIWKQAALASFIEKNEIGICIDSLEEIDSILQSLTNEKYQKLKENAYKISNKLANGEFTKKSLQIAMSQLNSYK